MKKIILFLLTILLFVLPVVYASDIKVQLNGEYIDFTDENGNVVKPELIRDRTMVPMRKIFEELGATIEWNSETRTVTATKDGTTIILTIDSMKATKKIGENSQEITLDSAPVILNNRTMVPVRFIAESLDKQVGWQQDESAVIIIDYATLKEKFKNSAPNFYEFVNADYKKVDSNSNTIAINGSLEYRDLDDSKQNEKLNLKATIDSKSNNILSELDSAINISGNGQIYETYKEAGYDKFNFDMIFDQDNKVAYMKSELFGEATDGKWIKTSLDSLDYTTLYGEVENLKGFDAFIETVKIPESTLTIDSFKTLNEQFDVLCEALGNKYFTVSGSTSKTYTLKLDKEFLIKNCGDLLSILKIEKTNIEEMQLEIKFKVKDNILDIYSINSEVKIIEPTSNEEIIIILSVKNTANSYNKPVTITLPKERDIFELDY
jgi:hypothetical protein